MSKSVSIVGGDLYRDRVLRDGTVGYWRLGDAVGSGTAADTSGLGRTGTVFGGVTFGQAGPIADGDTAALFASGYITATITALGASFSIEAWIKYTSIGYGNIAEAAGAQVYITSGYVTFLMAGVSGGSALRNNNVWHHVVATYDGATVRLYVDGSLVGNNAVVSAMDGTVFNIGRYYGGGAYFDGSIDDVAIYPTALTAEQIAAHYGLRLAAVHGEVLLGGSAGIRRGACIAGTGGLLIGGSAGVTRGVTILGGKSLTVSGTESLSETDFATHDKWNEAGGFAITGGAATYTHSGGTGLILQEYDDWATSISGNTRYRFAYTISGLTGTAPDAVITGVDHLSSGIAAADVPLPISNGLHSVDFLTEDLEQIYSPFVIFVESTEAGSFTIDDVSLQELVAVDDGLLVGGLGIISAILGGVGTALADSAAGAIAEDATFVYGVGLASGDSTAAAEGQAGLWPESLTLRPTVTDDGWGGALSYAWAQLSGPDTATIVSPTSQWTQVFFPETTGVYVFALTVTRADDDLVGIGLWRVTVYTAAPNPSGANLGAITVIANGTTLRTIVKSVKILAQNLAPGTCKLSTSPGHAEVGNDIIVTRGAVRLFGGVCLNQTREIDEAQHIFYHHSVTGYAWHLGRLSVTAKYEQTSATTIVKALLVLAPGGIQDDYVADGLESLTIEWDDVPIDEAIRQVAQRVGAHAWVDFFKRMHFAIVETAGDPLALSPAHPTFQHLAITDDLSQVANRVTVKYDLVTSQPALVDAEIPVESLDGYSSGGGLTTIDGNTIAYTGTREGLVDSVYGPVQLGYDQIPRVDGGDLSEGIACGYLLTIVTAAGETPAIMSASAVYLAAGQTAFDVLLTALIGNADRVARINRINLYRTSNEGAGVTFLVGSLLPTVGSRFLDGMALVDVPTPLIEPPTENTADEMGYWLTGCSGSQDIHTPASVTVNDLAAQADLAARLGGTDDGVVAVTLRAGTISSADAAALAARYLEAMAPLQTTVSVDVRDDQALPGQTLSVNFPAPIACVADLTIQQATIGDLVPGIPHKYAIVAAKDRVTMEDLLRQSAKTV